MKKLIFVFSILAVLFSCNSSRKMVYQQTDFQIKFGSSGGFTNAVEQYLINGDRNVFKVKGEEKTFLKQISKKQFNEIKGMLKELNFEQIELTERGNMTYFIEVNTPEYSNRILWSNGNENVEAQNLYKQLALTLKD